MKNLFSCFFRPEREDLYIDRMILLLKYIRRLQHDKFKDELLGLHYVLHENFWINGKRISPHLEKSPETVEFLEDCSIEGDPCDKILFACKAGIMSMIFNNFTVYYSDREMHIKTDDV